MSTCLINKGKIYYGCHACKDDPIFRGVHDVPVEGDRAWGFNGDLDRPTLSPSVRTGHGDFGGNDPWAFTCHHFLKGGVIEYCSDSTHGRGDSSPVLPVRLVGDHGLVELLPEITP